MRIQINADTCMGSGNCSFWAPEVFDLDDNGIAAVIEGHGAADDKVRAAAAACPTQSIVVHDAGEAGPS